MMRYLLLSLGASVSFALFATVGIVPAWSQSNSSEVEARPSSSSERDTFSSGLGDGFNPFDLIHRSNLNRNMSREEYLRRQQRQLDSEASNFRQQQKQLLRQERNEVEEQSPGSE